MKHILVISQYFYPEQFRINDLCSEWIKRGYKVTVVTGIPNYPQGEFYKGYGWRKRRTELYREIEIIRLPIISRGSGSLRLILNYLSFIVSGFFWAHFTNLKADCVFTYEVSPMTQALVGIWFSKRKKISNFIYITDLWPENIIAVTGLKNIMLIKLIQKLVNYIYKKNNLIFTSSESFVREIVKQNINKEKVIFWPQYAEDFYKPVSFRKGLLPLDRFNITFAGNIGKAQGLNVLVGAAEYLKKENILICFNIIGAGREKAYLVEHIRKVNVKNYFNFIESKPPEEIPEYLAASDAVIICFAKNPVFSITIPAKTQSCLACGKPILVSADGEISDIIQNAQCGLCSKAGSEIDLAENIKYMIKAEPETINIWKKNALEYSNIHFKKQKLLKIMDFYLGEYDV